MPRPELGSWATPVSTLRAFCEKISAWTRKKLGKGSPNSSIVLASSNPSATTASQALSQFKSSGGFPLEIRLMIWRWISPAPGVATMLFRSKGPRLLEYQLPIGLSICLESRCEVQKHLGMRSGKNLSFMPMKLATSLEDAVSILYLTYDLSSPPHWAKRFDSRMLRTIRNLAANRNEIGRMLPKDSSFKECQSFVGNLQNEHPGLKTYAIVAKYLPATSSWFGAQKDLADRRELENTLRHLNASNPPPGLDKVDFTHIVKAYNKDVTSAQWSNAFQLTIRAPKAQPLRIMNI